MENNLNNMELQLDEADKIKHKEDIKNNRDHLNSLKNKSSSEFMNLSPKNVFVSTAFNLLPDE